MTHFHPLSRSGWRRSMAGMGHEDAFPRPRLSARCRFSQRTFAGPRGNGRDAPTTVIRRAASNRPVSITRSRHRSRGLTLHPSQSEFPAAPTRRCFCLPPGSDPMCSRRSGARQRRPRRSIELSRQSRDRPQARRSCARVSASSNPPPGILTGLVDSCSMPGPSSEIAAIR